ncbi:hypothetical protein OS493_024858 [Desmophyllum pertusum]|uniref:START domain-containing protein n=1 Tax=Desmophyllum pertusum TaxID=174260 RepID=A0A9X0CRG3_9CNID|nr:hypothetical protein OS493_024858 [Desmophyllum pertusum]
MQSKESESWRSVSYEEELQRAKWYKEDLDKGDGWTLAAKGPGYSYWIKTIGGDEVPIKIIYTVDMPFPADVFVQLLDAKNLQARNDWDKSFVEHEILGAYPDGYVTYMRALLSWPLTDRSFVLYLPTSKEVDWYGKRARFLLIKHGWHPSKPEGEDGLIRATNGGNFYVVMPDENQPEAACRVFGLTNNLYNGWIPKTNMEWMQKRIVPGKFNEWRENMVEGYKKYFKN